MNDKNLKSMDLTTLQSIFPAPADARDAQAGLKADRLLVRRHSRQMMDMTRVANCAKTLDRLPAEGESFHVICRGGWHGFALIGACLKIAGRPIKALHISTLGYSRDNAEELLSLLDAGTIRTVAMIISCFFRSGDAELVDYLAAALAQRGQRFCAVRNHSKILAMDFGDDGPAIVSESSANLRSCRNLENFVLTNSRELLHFHQQWMDTVLAGGDAK